MTHKPRQTEAYTYTDGYYFCNKCDTPHEGLENAVECYISCKEETMKSGVESVASKAVIFGDIVEQNGKTIRENNSEIEHSIPVGALVEFKSSEWHGNGACEIVHARWWVVEQNRDCDGTPLYSLSPMRPQCLLPPGEKKDKVMLYYPEWNVGGPDYKVPGGLPGTMFNEDFSRKKVENWKTGFPEHMLTVVEVTDRLKDGHGSLEWPADEDEDEKMEQAKKKTYFPILLQWTKTGEYQVMSHPDKITPGRSFNVIQTNIETI